MNRNKFIQERLKEHYNDVVNKGFEVVAIFVQGSQNYEMDEYSDEYQSDLDTKCFILPTLNDIVSGKAPYSSTYVRENNEHIYIKDIRVFFNMLEKQNTAYVETLFTDFYIINPKYEDLVNELLSRNEKIARINENQALRCLAGMSMEKYKALEHPYPTTLDKIEKYGYDPKQLHHILRINDLMKKYIAGVPYKECLSPNHASYLMQVKKGLHPLFEARRVAEETDLENKKLKENNSTPTDLINTETLDFLNELERKFIKRFLKEEVLKDDE
jgi:hypothetical protein